MHQSIIHPGFSKDAIQNLCYWWQFPPVPLRISSCWSKVLPCKKQSGHHLPSSWSLETKENRVHTKAHSGYWCWSLTAEVYSQFLGVGHSGGGVHASAGRRQRQRQARWVGGVATVWFPGPAAQEPNSALGEVRGSTPFSTERIFQVGRQQLFSCSLASTLENSWWGSPAYSCLLKMIWL